MKNYGKKGSNMEVVQNSAHNHFNDFITTERVPQKHYKIVGFLIFFSSLIFQNFRQSKAAPILTKYRLTHRACQLSILMENQFKE